MKNQERPPKFFKERRFYTVLPLLILPFLSLFFWTLGGGKALSSEPESATQQKGLNVELPGARLKTEKPLNKLSYYQQADADSAKWGQQLRNDPYLKEDRNDFQREREELFHAAPLSENGGGQAFPTSRPTDHNEQKVYEKLAELDKSLRVPEPAPTTIQAEVGKSAPAVDKSDIDRLEKMMNHMQSGEGADDPELDQLNQMMETILDIQHPERLEDKLQQQSIASKGRVFPVSREEPGNFVSTLDQRKSKKADDSISKVNNLHSGFYSLEDQRDTVISQNAIRAAVYEDQTVVSGATVKFRLLDRVFINGVEIPKNTPLFGEVALSGERLTCTISSITYHNSIFPVQLNVFDVDGLDGIHIKGAISRDVSRQSGDRAIQGIGMSGIGTSLEAQAASAAIEGSKSLFSKKLKLIEVDLKAGYLVLLKDKQQKD